MATQRRERTALPLASFAAATAAVLPAQGPQFVLDTPATIAVATFQNCVAADVDGDGDPDLLGSRIVPFGPVLELRRNDGNGAFTDVTASQLPTLGAGLATVLPFDADADGDVDLFAGGATACHLLRNQGNGTFVTTAGQPSLAGVLGATAADLDGDGDLDLAITGSVLTSSADRVLVNNGSGTFTLGPVFGSGLSGGVAAIDYDADGDRDLVYSDSTTRLWRNDGGLVFTDVSASHLFLTHGVQAGGLAVGDLDGDGDVDLVLRGSAGDVVVTGGGGALTSIGVLPTQPATTRIVLVDVDRDGDLDVVRAHGQSPLSLALNNGNATFVDGAARLPTPAVNAIHVHPADFDRDGDADLVAIEFSSSVRMLRNRHVDLLADAAVVGQDWNVTIGSQPGYTNQTQGCLLAIAPLAVPQPVAVPGLGEVWLDLGSGFLLYLGAIPPTTGATSFVFPLPPWPQLVGITMHVQGLVEQIPGPARATAYRRVVIQ